MLFYNYINETRPKLLKGQAERSRSLILTKAGTPEKGEGISYFLETSKHLFPDRNLNMKTIRQSVIANLLKSGQLRYCFKSHQVTKITAPDSVEYAPCLTSLGMTQNVPAGNFSP